MIKKNIKIDISSIQYWNVRSNKKTRKKNKKTKIKKLIKKNVSKTTKHTGPREACAHGIIIFFWSIYIYFFFKKKNTQKISYLVENTSNLSAFLTHNLSFGHANHSSCGIKLLCKRLRKYINFFKNTITSPSKHPFSFIHGVQAWN
jgi:hypothetical protein